MKIKFLGMILLSFVMVQMSFATRITVENQSGEERLKVIVFFGSSGQKNQVKYVRDKNYLDSGLFNFFALEWTTSGQTYRASIVSSSDMKKDLGYITIFDNGAYDINFDEKGLLSKAVLKRAQPTTPTVHQKLSGETVTPKK